MDRHLKIKLRPFSVRHKRLVHSNTLPSVPADACARLWSTLELLCEPYYFSTPDNPTWINTSSDLDEVESLYRRLVGITPAVPEGKAGGYLAAIFDRGPVWAQLDIVECFCAWVEPERALVAQEAINEVFRDFACRWRLSAGMAFLVDNAFIEDEVLAEVSPLLALSGFEGSKSEFQRARDSLTEGMCRDAIFYAAASVESALKAALGGSAKVGLELSQAYANAGLLHGLPVAKAQAIHRSLMPTAVLRNELAGHGHGAEELDVPREYAQLAVSLAAAALVFISSQQMRRRELERPQDIEIVTVEKRSEWADDDIPF